MHIKYTPESGQIKPDYSKWSPARFGLAIMLTGLTLMAAEPEQYFCKIDLGNGHFYSCNGKIVRQKNKVTKTSNFFNQDGKNFLTETVIFDERDYKLIKLSINEKRYGRQQEIIRDGDNYRVRYRKNADKDFTERTIADQPLILHGSYLPIYLSQNLDLIGKNGHTCRLIIVPQKLEVEMIFRNMGVKIINGRKCYEIQMDAANLLLKPLVKTHYFYFGVEAPYRLYRYIGTIAPTAPNGDSIWGTISFSYN